MGKRLLKNGILLISCLFPFFMDAQNTDCRTSIVICSDQSFSFLPSGSGIDDFANPNNSQGCLFTRETISAWFYFEFREDMPPESEITFEIKDTLREFKVDYDFAVYGSEVNCDNLGEPVRCSFARLENLSSPGQTVSTGLRVGESDTTETFLNANGFLKPLTVQPGEGFFLIVDMFVSTDTTGGFESFDSTRAQSFSFDWGGSAAPFLNCVANPNCDQVVVNAGADTTICAGTQIVLQASATNTAGQESYAWTGTDGATAFIDDPTAANTFATIPFDFTGEITFSATVSEGACIHDDDFLVMVDPAGEPSVTGDTLICEGATAALSAQEGFASYEWSDGSVGRNITVSGSGVYQVTVTSGSGCPGIAEITVFNYPVPDPTVTGPTGFCPGGQATLQAVDGFVSYLWSTGSTEQSITVNTADTYILTVSDTFGCTIQRDIDIAAFANPVPVIDGPRAICSGDLANLSGENGFLSYEWSTGETTQNVSYDAAGTYTLTVIDTNTCRGSADVTITERENPLVTIVGQTIFCSNEEGSLTATPGFIRYQWSNGDSLPAISIANPGLITVTVTDQFGCEGDASIFVDTLSTPNPVFDSPDYFCAGSSVTLQLTETYVSYDWSDESSGSFIEVDQAGTYRVLVTDENNCIGEGEFQVREEANPIPVLQGQDRLCPGDQTTLSTINSYSSYNWSTGSTQPSITTSTINTYTVSVTNSLGCMGEGSITLIPLSSPVVTISGLDAICDGDEATLIANAGFREYQWSTGARTQSIEVSNPNNYSVTVTDENGCQAFESVNFNVNPNPKPRIDGSLRLCEGETTQIQVQGGNFTDYRWSTGDSLAAITVEVEAEYAVTVTTQAGCTNADTVFVEAFRPIPSPLAGGEIPLCEGESLTLDAGPGFIDYNWSTGERTQEIMVDSAGVYQLAVLDSNICISETEIIVQVFQVRQPTIIGQSAFCSGQRTTLIAGGNYRLYEWSNGAEGKSIQIDTGGLYSLTVTDNNGCQASVSRNIQEEESPNISISGPNVLCDSDTITLTVEEGYSNYLWTTNESGNTITVTDPGLYGVLVFSANGCASSAEVVIQQRSVPLVGIDGPNNICSNEIAVLDPGSDYLIYSWSTGDTTQTIEVNQPGIYELTVFDRFGCEGFARALLQVREAPDFDIVGPNALCDGDTINLAITSDSLYRSYLWSDGTMDPNLEVRQPGMYSVSVTANNNCLTEDSIDIMPLLAPEPQIVGDTNFCAGGFTILEADTIYAAYQWTGGRSSQSIRISTAGVYELRVTSVEGCVGTDEVLVNALALPDADAGPDSILNCYQPEIQLGRMISTDQERFLYTWSGPGITNDQQYGPQPIVSEGGTYILEVQDTLFGCPPAQDEVIITDIQYTPQLNIASQDTLDCIDTSITIVAIAEVGPDIEYQWIQLSQNQLRSTTPEILINQGGNYSFTVLDTLTGCNQIDTIAIIANQQPPLLKEPTIGFINCRKDSHILIAPQAPIGSLWSYAWARADGTFGTPSIDSLRQTVFEPGFYGIRVEDTENGCVTFDSLLVRDDRNFPDVMAGPDDELDCTFTEVRLGVPVDNRDWIISWTRLEDFTFGSSLPQPTVDQPGTYVVEAFDPRTGCTQIDSVTITQYDNAPDSLELRINDVVCYGERNGLIQVLGVTGGEQPLLYSLNERPFSSGRQFANLEAGAYNLIVQDARGCELRQRILVQPGNDVFVDLGPDQYIQQGDRVRLRALTSIPDGQVRELRWTRPDTLSCDTCIIQNLLPLETMNLQAIAVDTNGCRGQDNVNIFVDKRKRVYIPTAFSPDGDGLNDVIMIYAARDVQRVRSWRIFDRWGELVWEKQDFPPNDPTFGWDGQWRNALQQKRKQEDRFILMNAQVYVYYAEIEFIDGDVVLFKGDFTLMK